MNRQRKVLLVIYISALLLIFIIASSNYLSNRKLYLATSYLKSHFNETVGIIFESEDKGIRTIGESNYTHDQIYYIYSDNLLTI